MASDHAKHFLERLKRLGHTEELSYTPGGGEARTLTAVVDRDGLDDQGNTIAPRLRVTVLNDEADGIPLAELDTGTDTIDVADRLGGTARTRQFRQIVLQDSDFLTMEVR